MYETIPPNMAWRTEDLDFLMHRNRCRRHHHKRRVQVLPESAATIKFRHMFDALFHCMEYIFDLLVLFKNAILSDEQQQFYQQIPCLYQQIPWMEGEICSQIKMCLWRRKQKPQQQQKRKKKKTRTTANCLTLAYIDNCNFNEIVHRQAPATIDIECLFHS